MNFPQHEKIGDYQIEIDNKKNSNFNVHQIKCQMDFCVTTCATPEPSLRRFRQTKIPKKELQVFMDISGKIVEEKRTISAGFNMMIGNVNIAYLEVEKAICDIRKISSYGCIGCNQKPYVIFQADSIKKEGIIPFTSNCTFNKKYLSCSTEAFALEVEQLHTHCYIFMASINKTLMIDTDIEFVGHINPSVPQMSAGSQWETAKSLVINWDFANYATYAMAGASIFGILLRALNNTFRVYCLRKEIRNVDRNKE